MWVAKSWTPHTTASPTGTQANAVVNDTYHQLDQAFLDYIGPPYISNWFTYGKWASREAGQGINNLSSAMTALMDLVPSKLEAAALVLLAANPFASAFATYLAAHAQQLQVLTAISTNNIAGAALGQPTMAYQMLKLCLSTLGVQLNSPSDFNDPKFQAKLILALIEADSTVLAKFWNNLQTMVTCLIDGNQGIYRNMAPAADAFLKGEANGFKGIDALTAFVKQQPGNALDLWSGGTTDPQSFLVNAFTMYTQARTLGQMINDPSQAAQKDALTQKRQTLMHIANVMIGCQEQMCILQSPRVFTNATMRWLVQGQGGAMMLHDAMASPKRLIPLLPNGGDWTNFATRMGVTAQAKSDSTVHVDNPYEGGGGDYGPTGGDPGPDGTIYNYFKTSLCNADGSKNANMTTSPSNSDWLNVDRYPTGIPSIV